MSKERWPRAVERVWCQWEKAAEAAGLRSGGVVEILETWAGYIWELCRIELQTVYIATRVEKRYAWS